MDNLAVTTYRVEGEPEPTDVNQIPETDIKVVSEDYFRTVGTPILRGAAPSPVRTPLRTARTWSSSRHRWPRQIAPHGDAMGAASILRRQPGQACDRSGESYPTRTRWASMSRRGRSCSSPGYNIREMALMLRAKGDPAALEGAGAGGGGGPR